MAPIGPLGQGGEAPTKRSMTKNTGDTKGTTTILTCHPGPDFEIPCSGPSGYRAWLFKGNRYTTAFLLGSPLGGDPNIWVAHGTCVKF